MKKRPLALLTLLLLAALVWGGLRLQDSRWHRWLATAPRSELEKYNADHPDQPEVLVRLGVLLRNAGESAEAQKRLQRAAEISPDLETAWVELSRTLPDDREAIEKLENFLKVEPESAPVLAELARRYVQAGDTARARKLAEDTTRQSPQSPDAWRSLGDVMAALHQLPDAEKAYRRSLSLHAEPATQLALARILLPLQRYPEIVALCSPIVQAGPSADIAPEQRARALLYTAGGRLYSPLKPEEIAVIQTQLQEADSLATKGELEDRFLSPYFLGESYLRLGKPQEAIPYLERSVQEGPMFAGSLYSLARAYRLAGETVKADAATARHVRLSRLLSSLDMYQNRLAQRPEDVESMLRLADTLAEIGNTAQAAQIYRHLISHGQLAEAAQRKLRALPGIH